MRRVFLVLFYMVLGILPTYALEIEQPKAVQTLYHVLPEEEQTIHDEEPQYDDYYFPAEVELKGSVIYDGGVTANEIELDKDIQKPKIKLKTSNMIIPVTERKIFANVLEVPRSALSNASRLTGEEYYIAPVWSYVKEQVGNFSYGTQYTSGIDTSQLQTTMNLYTRYDFKYFALTGAVGTNEKNIEGINDRTIQIAPEIKLSKSFVIRDTVQAYVNDTVKKNKISIIYTPQWQKCPGMVRIELGITNSYYTGGKVNSAVEFSTRIRL
ncbi:MAG: hypothetical protein NC200_02480 [Candidatus Gastranaerophilales bacterium]|nr:hypothetical protein [Candidatus Gastranaerophilales bacterium]